MKIDFDNYEYKEIVKDILNNREFKKIELCPHHKINRLVHSKRVSYYSYKICKKLGFDYVSAARGGLLHDFFLNKYNTKNSWKLLISHPSIALNNAKKHFVLSDKEKNIIKCHMFPVSISVFPKYRESVVVSLVDKVMWFYEKVTGYSKEINYNLGKAAIYVFLFLNS